MPFVLKKTWANPDLQRLALWVADMMDAAGETAGALMVSREAIVAQAALESAWGKASIGHNIFGIKADDSWKGPKLLRRTAEQMPDGSVYYVDAFFRDYPDFRACIADHFAFLTANSRYRSAGVFDAHNDRGYFEALQRAGYATDVRYADKLMTMIGSVRLFSAFMEETAPTVAEAIGAAIPSSAPSAAPAVQARTLLIGLHGSDVEALQVALVAKGYDVGASDGAFGPKTDAAVRAFQKSAGLAVDGIAGPATLKALES